MHAQNSDEKIHVALAVRDLSGTFSEHAGVTMTSIFENTSSPVAIHILHDETLTQDNREKFIKTAEKYSQQVNFIDMTKYRDQFTTNLQKFATRLTIGALYRTFIPHVLGDLKKVIYLDCDILVNLDIHELWDIDFDNKSFAAVFEIMSPSKERALKLKLCGINIENYINSGVLFMNAEKIREGENFFNRVVNWIEQNHKLTPTVDQDAINSLFRGDIKFIDAKFNLYDLSQDISNSIVHYWAGKPWKKFTGAAHEKLYWQMYLKSAWGENCTLDDIIDKIASAGFHISEYEYENFYHERGKQCIARLVRGILQRFKNIFYLIKYKLLMLKF